MIDKIREELPDWQKALDVSVISERDGACYDIETWLYTALAAYAEISGNGGVQFSFENSSAYSAFNRVIKQALEAMKTGETPEEFYNTPPAGGQSLAKAGISALVKGFCRNHGTDWKVMMLAICSGKTGVLPGNLGLMAEVLAELLPEMTDAVGEAQKSSPSQEFMLEWCAAIIAAYCRTKEALLAFISDWLGRYIERWRIPDSEDYFPYAMKSTRYMWYRTHASKAEVWSEDKNVVGGGKEDWDKKWETKLIEIEKKFVSSINSKRFVLYKNEFCQVEYGGYKEMKNGGYTKDDDGFFVKLKEQDVYLNYKEKIDRWYIQEGDGYQETFDLQIYNMLNQDCNSRYGKGSPELMQFVVRKLRDSGMPTDKENLTNFALGIDCSGFVTRAIVSLMIELKIPVSKQVKTIGPGYGRLKTNSTTLRSAGNRNIFTFRYLTNTKQKFICKGLENPPQKDFDHYLQTGDVVMKKRIDDKDGTILDDGFHIWIVKDVTPDSFILMESTAYSKIGPRMKKHTSLKTFVSDAKLTKGVTTIKKKKKDAKGNYLKDEKGELIIITRVVNWTEIIDFARPLIFVDSDWLSNYYIRFLMDNA